MDILEKELDVVHAQFEHEIASLVFDSYTESGSAFLESPKHDRGDHEGADLADKIESFIADLIRKIKQLYLTVREKIRQVAVIARLKKLQEGTVYNMYCATDNKHIARDIRKLISYQDQGLVKLHSIYIRALAGKIPYDSAIRQGRIITETYKKKISDAATGMLLANINLADRSVSKKTTRAYKKEITRVLTGYLKEHEDIIANLERGIVEFDESLVDNKMHVLNSMKINYRGLAHQFANFASSLNNLILRYESKIVVKFFSTIAFFSAAEYGDYKYKQATTPKFI